MLVTPAASELIDVDTARRIALDQVRPITALRDLALTAALGQVAARHVFATCAMPFFTNSAVDGFALRQSDLTAADLRLPIAGTIAAGTDQPRALPPGTALRIFTGAPAPEGADTVVALEDTREEDGTLVLSSWPKPGANLRLAGSDQPKGACLLHRGTRITPHHIGLLAANGIARVCVLQPPRVVVLSTGDELAAAGTNRAFGQVHDANRPMLLALAQAAGAEASDGGALPDCVEALAERLLALSETADLIVTSGGVSMGGRDPIRPAFLAAGGSIGGWKVAIKPGKPVVFGRLGKAAFTGLPGNPFAAFAGFALFVAPQLAAMTGQTPAPFAPFRGRAAFDWQRRPGRQEVIPVRNLGPDTRGLPRLERLGNSVSATLFPLAAADGLAVVPAETASVAIGDLLSWHPFCAG